MRNSFECDALADDSQCGGNSCHHQTVNLLRRTARAGLSWLRSDYSEQTQVASVLDLVPTLKKHRLEEYVHDRFGQDAKLLTFGPIGEETSYSAVKGYGYGAPIRLTIQVGRHIHQAVLETMKPGPVGHEHPADRAQALLWDFDSYGRLPRHVSSLDVGEPSRNKAASSPWLRRGNFFCSRNGPMEAAMTTTWLGWPVSVDCRYVTRNAARPLCTILCRSIGPNDDNRTCTAVDCGNLSAMVNASWG